MITAFLGVRNVTRMLRVGHLQHGDSFFHVGTTIRRWWWRNFAKLIDVLCGTVTRTLGTTATLLFLVMKRPIAAWLFLEIVELGQERVHDQIKEEGVEHLENGITRILLMCLLDYEGPWRRLSYKVRLESPDATTVSFFLKIQMILSLANESWTLSHEG